MAELGGGIFADGSTAGAAGAAAAALAMAAGGCGGEMIGLFLEAEPLLSLLLSLPLSVLQSIGRRVLCVCCVSGRARGGRGKSKRGPSPSLARGCGGGVAGESGSGW